MNKKLQQAIQFIIDNDGIIVTSNFNNFACYSCGARAMFASDIAHHKDCVLNTLKNAAENMQLSLNFS